MQVTRRFHARISAPGVPLLRKLRHIGNFNGLPGYSLLLIQNLFPKFAEARDLRAVTSKNLHSYLNR